MSDGFALFKDEAVSIGDRFPKLTFSVEESGRPYLSGLIDLVEEDGNIVDSYNITIKPTDEYPSRFPYVYELDGRLPNNLDWHVYSDGHCCIKARPEEILICSRGISLSNFITDHIIPYFFNQKHRELYGYFLQERSHGNQGNLESLYEIFKTDDKLVIVKCLEFIRKGQRPDRVSLCFCGSGKKYRKCHRDVYNLLNHFTDKEIMSYLLLLDI